MKVRQLSLELRAKLWRAAHNASLIMAVGCVALGLYSRSILGRDALCEAAYYGRLGEMRLLLNAGADPNRMGWDTYCNPLSDAVRGGQIDAARLLLDWGADPNAEGRSAIDLGLGSWGVAEAKKALVAALLRSAGGQE